MENKREKDKPLASLKNRLLKFYFIPNTDDRGYEVFGENINKQKYPC